MRVSYRRLRFVVLCLVVGGLFAAFYYHWATRDQIGPEEISTFSPIKLESPFTEQSSEAKTSQPTAATKKEETTTAATIKEETTTAKLLMSNDNPWKGLIVKSPHLPFRALPLLPVPKYTHPKPPREFEKPAHQKLKAKQVFNGANLVYPQMYDEHPIDFDDVLVLNENGVDEEKLNVARTLQAQKRYRKIMNKL